MRGSSQTVADTSLFGPHTMNGPWGLDSRLKLVALACDFFNVKKIAAHHATIGKALSKQGNPTPLTAADFLQYLHVKSVFPKAPNAFRVARILERMVSTGLLVHVGSGSSSVTGLQNHYIYALTPHDARRGLFRLVPVLGPQYLFRLCEPGLVHITGTNAKGDEVAGTGLVVDSRHILTCRHVVSDMTVNPRQTFQGSQYAVDHGSIRRHTGVDVAVVPVEGPPLSPLDGALMQAPVVGMTVYTLGYPKLPGLRDASLTMQQGAVTNQAVASLTGERLFLYSAISRPGNSGGPVVSEDGYVVGLASVDATGLYGADEAFSPHYAGIPAQVVVHAVQDLGLGIELPFEHYE